MEHISLKKLVLSAQNVRTNVEDATDIAGLVASIEAHGLLSPLVVTKGKKPEVVAGGRRYRALCKLAEVRSIAHRICAGEVDPKISAMDATELVAAQAWVPAWLRFKDEQPQ